MSLNDEPLDGRAELVLEMSREEIYNLMMMAHRQDITLNKLIEKLIIDYMNE
jgi:hypothetical protein